MGRIVVVVSPGGRQSQIVGRYGDAWKLRVKAAPEHGRANGDVRALLSRALSVPREAVSIEAGLTSRRKIVAVAGVETKELERRLGVRCASDVRRRT